MYSFGGAQGPEEDVTEGRTLRYISENLGFGFALILPLPSPPQVKIPFRRGEGGGAGGKRRGPKVGDGQAKGNFPTRQHPHCKAELKLSAILRRAREPHL